VDTKGPDPNRLKLLDLANGFLALIALICLGISKAVTIQTTWWQLGILDQGDALWVQSLLLNMGAGLLTVPVLYAFSRWLFFDPTSPRIETFFGSPSDRIFELAQGYLQQTATAKKIITVRIYAPVGIWYEGDQKDRWLETVSRFAHDRRIYLKAVFGLPVSSEQDLKDANSIAQKRLQHLSKKHSLEVRYFPPPFQDMTAAPGLGMIIFDDQLAFFGFAPQETHGPVACGFTVKGKQVLEPVLTWFDQQCFHETCSMLLIHNSGNIEEDKFQDAFDKIIKSYYP
jgi:hypothetical protein